MRELEFVKCPICREGKEELLMKTLNTHGSSLITDERFNLVKCRDCGLVYINPRPKQDEIGRFYDIDYYTTGNRFKRFIEEFVTLYFNLYKKALITKYKQSGRLLDIGCGTGDFLLSLPTDRWELYGIEPNDAGYEISVKRVKGKIFNNKLIDCKFPDAYFDIVNMWHVFEHIFNPNEELREIKRILKNEGVFILGIPNIHSLGYRVGKAYWFHMDSPRHLYHYNPRTIKKILNKNGFYVSKIIFPFFEYPLDIFHSLLNFISIDKNKLIRISLALPLLIFSLLLKPIASLLKNGETMIVLCGKEVRT